MNKIDNFHDYSPAQREFYLDVIEGLQQSAKQLPCKYFYDERGSRLFEEICDLEEYYPTRTELALLERFGADIARRVGNEAELIEFGGGALQKVRLLLHHLPRLKRFVPIDISREHLLAAVNDLSGAFPELNILPVCADYTSEFNIPKARAEKRVGFFPGSTIGNFSPADATSFLRGVARILGKRGELIIGVDLKKDERILRQAYNDKAGVTAAFNLNLLERINRELGADFDIEAFEHDAFYEPEKGRVEMHLQSTVSQTVTIGSQRIEFDKGETIHTENSHKYGIEEFQALAGAAGYCADAVWTDDDRLFSVHYLRVSD